MIYAYCLQDLAPIRGCRKPDRAYFETATCWLMTPRPHSLWPKDPNASDVLYIKALAAPLTINTMLEGTLKAFADHGEVGPTLPANGGDCEAMLAKFAKADVDIEFCVSNFTFRATASTGAHASPESCIGVAG